MDQSGTRFRFTVAVDCCAGIGGVRGWVAWVGGTCGVLCVCVRLYIKFRVIFVCLILILWLIV